MNDYASNTTIPIEQQGPALTQYSYDQLHRIMGMAFWQGMRLDANEWQGQQHFFQEAYTYDANGNIQTLQRTGVDNAYMNGRQIMSGHVTDMDNLTYHYGTGDLANQLQYVSDGVSSSNYSGSERYGVEDIDDQPSGNYEYDLIGRLTRDVSQGIIIFWNVWNKVDSVVNSTKGISTVYYYDALGNRVAKVIRKNASFKYTLYSRDHSGNTMATYTGTGYDMHAESAEIYGAKRIGTFNYITEDYFNVTNLAIQNDSLRSIGELDDITLVYANKALSVNVVAKTNSIFGHTNMSSEVCYLHTRIAGSRQYELYNHLGNVLATISDRKLAVPATDVYDYTFFDADILSATDYYPFGMAMPGRTFRAPAYRWGFNGKENDNSGEWGDGLIQDYGLRLYNPALCKFLSVDPLMQKFPWWSPYAFAGNTPIQAIDLDGGEIHHFIDIFKSRYWNDSKMLLTSNKVLMNYLRENWAVIGNGDQFGAKENGKYGGIILAFAFFSRKEAEEDLIAGITQIGVFSDNSINATFTPIQNISDFNSNSVIGIRIKLDSKDESPINRANTIGHELFLHGDNAAKLIKSFKDGQITQTEFFSQLQQMNAAQLRESNQRPLGPIKPYVKGHKELFDKSNVLYESFVNELTSSASKTKTTIVCAYVNSITGEVIHTGADSDNASKGGVGAGRDESYKRYNFDFGRSIRQDVELDRRRFSSSTDQN